MDVCLTMSLYKPMERYELELKIFILQKCVRRLQEESERWSDWPKVTELGCSQEPKTSCLLVLLHVDSKMFMEHLQWIRQPGHGGSACRYATGI